MRPLDYLKMEFLQVAYVNAVVANAGKSCDAPRRDAGIDIRVVDWIQDPENLNKYEDGGVVFNCQLKASTRCTFNKKDELVFPMKVRDYNKLVNWPGTGIKILVAFDMPNNIENWYRQNHDILCLKNCCYWEELTGRDPSPNKPDSTYNLKVPRESIFDSETVLQLTARARQGQYS